MADYIVRRTYKGETLYVSRITEEDQGFRPGGFFWHKDASRALRFDGNLQSVTFRSMRGKTALTGTLKGWLDLDAYAHDVSATGLAQDPKVEVILASEVIAPASPVEHVRFWEASLASKSMEAA